MRTERPTCLKKKKKRRKRFYLMNEKPIVRRCKYKEYKCSSLSLLFYWELRTDHRVDIHSKKVIRVHVEISLTVWCLLWHTLPAQSIPEWKESSEGDCVSIWEMFWSQGHRETVVQREETGISICQQQLLEGTVILCVDSLKEATEAPVSR